MEAFMHVVQTETYMHCLSQCRVCIIKLTPIIPNIAGLIPLRLWTKQRSVQSLSLWFQTLSHLLPARHTHE